MILYRLDHWFSCFNGFTLVNFGGLYSLLSGVNAPCWRLNLNLYCNGLILQIVTWMESCLIGAHTTSSYIYMYINQITCKYIMCCYTAIIYLNTCPGLSMKEYRWARSSIFRYSETKIIIIFKIKSLIFLFNNFQCHTSVVNYEI